MAVADSFDASRLRPGLSLSAAVETISLLLAGCERLAIQTLSAPDGRDASLPALQDVALMHLGRLRDGLYR